MTGTPRAALTSAPSGPSGWTHCRLRSGTYRLFAALVATKKPIPAAVVRYRFKCFLFFFSVFELAKDEVTMLQRMIHWEFMFWKIFPFACSLAFCQVLVPFSSIGFLFSSSTSCPCVVSTALIYILPIEVTSFLNGDTIAIALLFAKKFMTGGSYNRISKHLGGYHKAIHATDSVNGLWKP